jgi:LysM repeat protein
MESNQINYKKILLWFITIIGMILAATCAATVIFFSSITVKSIHHQPNRNFTSQIKQTSDSTSEATGETKTNPSVKSGFRDPFLPPASAWSNLTITAGLSNGPGSSQPNALSGGKNPQTSSKKPITSDGEKINKQRTKVNPEITVTPTPKGLEQQDPDSPEYKETLILPIVAQGSTEGYKTTYMAKKGETVPGISHKFGIDAESIFALNNLTPDDQSIEGRILTVPVPKTHLYRLKRNETLWRIATRYGVTVELLKEINNFTDSTKVEPEQIIILPVPVDQIVNKNY